MSNLLRFLCLVQHFNIPKLLTVTIVTNSLFWLILNVKFSNNWNIGENMVYDLVFYVLYMKKVVRKTIHILYLN